MAGRDEQLGFAWAEEPEKGPKGRRTRSKAPGERGGQPRREPQAVPDVLPRIAPLAARLRGLADRGVHIGTSSWKYPGWLGYVYDPARYTVRGKVAQAKFDRECLAEYARIFPTVGGDFSFYQFPSDDYWDRLFAQTPPGFRMGLKIPEDVTVETFPRHARYGKRAGQANPSFMDADMLSDRLLRPLEAHRDRLGVLMFEFGTIHTGPLREENAFADRLDDMLGRLPHDRFRFAVEIRNKNFLTPGGAYLKALRRHRTAHVLNSWTRMPSLTEQLAIPDIFTADHVAARFLLRPGRTYEEAVKMFSPYERVQEEYPEGRAALHELIARSLAAQRMLFAFVNNRFEGNAVETIEQVVGEA